MTTDAGGCFGITPCDMMVWDLALKNLQGGGLTHWNIDTRTCSMIPPKEYASPFGENADTLPSSSKSKCSGAIHGAVPPALEGNSA